MLIDVVCEAGGGSDEGKTPISEESLIRPTPMSLYYGVFRREMIFSSLVMVLGVMKSNSSIVTIFPWNGNWTIRKRVDATTCIE